MNIHEYIEAVVEDFYRNERRPWVKCEDIISAWDRIFAALNVDIEAEQPLFRTWRWFRDQNPAQQAYFEMCGPKIYKENAMKMAAEYQYDVTCHSTIGALSCYDKPEHIPNDCGLFGLDGCIGLNSCCDRKLMNWELIYAMLDMIGTHPKFEFALFITNWKRSPSSEETWYAHRAKPKRPTEKDVYVGFCYDPHKAKLKILGAESALRMVRRYQERYTPEERSRFDPEESSFYYCCEPKGRKAMKEFARYKAAYPVVRRKKSKPPILFAAKQELKADDFGMEIEQLMEREQDEVTRISERAD